MMNQKDQTMTHCNANECETITKREFLAYAFSSKLQYTMQFVITDGENPKEFCKKQVMNVFLFNENIPTS